MEISEDSSIGNPELFADYIDWRRENPSNNLMTELLRAEFEDDVHGLTSLRQSCASTGERDRARRAAWA